jgi:hypothetical protein
MKRFLVGADRGQSTLLPECLDEWIDESNPVRAVDAFVDALDLGQLGFEGVVPEVTGRPSYHPSAQALLDQCVRHLRDQALLHDGQGASHHPLGPRACTGGGAEASRRESSGHAPAPRDGRAPVRHAQDADGRDALPDEAAAEGRHRDGAAHPGL